MELAPSPCNCSLPSLPKVKIQRHIWGNAEKQTASPSQIVINHVADHTTRLSQRHVDMYATELLLTTYMLSSQRTT
jgi:hypothetical protein